MERVLRHSVNENAGSNRSQYAAHGHSVHRTDGLLHQAPDGVPYLAYLAALPADSAYSDNGDIVLLRRDYEADSDIFRFAVFNTFDEPLFVNVVEQRRPRDLFFDASVPVAQRGETVIEDYTFLKTDEPAGYIVIASPSDFGPAQVDSLLRGLPTARDFLFTLYRIP